VDFPILVGKEQVNRVTAIWQRPKSEIKNEELTEFYKFISDDYQARWDTCRSPLKVQ